MMMFKPIMRQSLAAITCAFASTAAANPPQFSLIELCAPSGMHSPVPLGMNDEGLIVGEAKDDGQGAYMAAVAWIDDDPVRLTGIAMSGAQAFGASNDGTVVGTTDESFVVKAFTWKNDEITLLSGTHGIAHAVNSSGTIVGSVHDGGSRAVRWMGGELEFLLPPATGSVAQDINTDGAIVGSMLSDNWRAFHWKDAQWTELPTLPNGTQARANAINDRGVIAGSATTTVSSFPKKAVLWIDGAIVKLDDADVTSSDAADINNAGLVVGSASSPGHFRAVLWHDGQMHDLNDLVDLPEGWILAEAFAIDNAGRIVGRGSQNGQPRAFLLTPAVLGDLNGDGHVDALDLLLLLSAWGPCPTGTSASPPCPADLNGDGEVDASDLLILLANWG